MQELGAIGNPMFKLKGPSMIEGKFPTAFPLKHQQKDMRLALALGDEAAQSMPVAAAANEVKNLLIILSASWLHPNLFNTTFCNITSFVLSANLFIKVNIHSVHSQSHFFLVTRRSTQMSE